MLFRQLFDSKSSTFTYLVADPTTGDAVIIDPVFEHVRRDAALLYELGLALRFVLETHVHADHVTAAHLLRERLGARVALSKNSGARGADLYLDDGDRIPFGQRYLEARSTPGHTNGCITYVLDDQTMAFTGDTLLVRAAGRTDFQQGNAHTMYRMVHQRIFTLPDQCALYPAHDYQGRTMTTVAEERRFNPRLGGAVGEEDFVGYMDNLRLPHPNQMDIAVPANLECGKPDQRGAESVDPTWAPLIYTFAGLWEVAPRWLEENPSAVQIVDVREPHELDGDLGRIAGANAIPLGQLVERKAELRADKPIVTVCRSGSRSAQAAVLLKREGFEQVANLAGGMLRWNAEGLPTVQGSGPPFQSAPGGA